MTIGYIAHDALTAVVATLAAQQRVLVPTPRAAVKRSVVFAPYEKGMDVVFTKATIAPKEVVLPQCETLLTFAKEQNEEGNTGLSLKDTPAAEATVLFGCRPCDARGIAVLDKPYLEGPYIDPYYKARRELLTVVTYACPTAGPTCFCHWFGEDSGPTSTCGSDVILTPLKGGEDGYLLEPVTEKGEALVAGMHLPDGTSRAAEAKAVREASVANRAPAPDLSGAQEKIARLFNDKEFWEHETAHCLSCGACTYMCPTCYCFNITDEGDGISGRRLRTWDTCMASLFTREASGHNSRTATAQRMKNRISHKFSNYPENWGSFSCSGCGRCVNNCPVSLDIRQIVLAALAKAE